MLNADADWTAQQTDFSNQRFLRSRYTSLFTTAALSVRTVAADGAHFDVLSLPRLRRSPPSPFGPGRKRLATIIARAIAFGVRWLATMASFAGSEIVNSGSPWRQAWMI